MARYSNQRKKSLMFCFVCIMLFIFGVTAGISYAYFSDSKNVTNTLNFGKLIIEANGTATTNVFVLGNATDSNGLLGAGDTIDFKGTVGLEENSINAYVRIKLDNFKYYQANTTTEATTKPSSSDRKAFIKNFLTEVAETTKDSTKQDWTYIDNYLYYGKMMSSSNAYAFNSSIEVTEDLVPTSFQGLTVQFDLVIQAIQASGAVNSDGTSVSISASETANAGTASSVASITMWESAFPEPVEPLTGSLSGVLTVKVINSTKNVTISKGNNLPTELVIPSFVRKGEENGTVVWYSSSDNFEGQEDAEDIYKVTSVGSSAFKGCTSLTSIIIPSSVICLEEYAFGGCTSLTSITFEDGSQLTSIYAYVFSGCSSLKSIRIPASVTSIGSNPTGTRWTSSILGGCSDLESIVVEAGNTVYDSRDNCNAIIGTSSKTLINGCKKTIIPDSVTSIGGSAFASCSGLASITIPASVTNIEMWAFYNCRALTSITIPASVTRIEAYAFQDCTSLTEAIFLNTSQCTWREYTDDEVAYTVTDKAKNAEYLRAGYMYYV